MPLQERPNEGLRSKKQRADAKTQIEAENEWRVAFHTWVGRQRGVEEMVVCLQSATVFTWSDDILGALASLSIENVSVREMEGVEGTERRGVEDK